MQSQTCNPSLTTHPRHYGGLTRSVEVHVMAPDQRAPVLWRAYVTPAAADIVHAYEGAPDAVDVTLQLSDSSKDLPLPPCVRACVPAC